MSDEYKPESVVLSDSSANMPQSTPTLLGTTATLTGAETLSESQPGMENVKFITGADGQTYAVMEQDPFVWKKFFIGLGIPVLILITAWIMVMIAESSNPWDGVQIRTLMSKNSGTEYTGTISLDEHYTEEIMDCWHVQDVGGGDRYSSGIYCYEDWENEGTIWIQVYDDQWGNWVDVGNVSTDGTVNYDDGVDYGESFSIEFDFRDSAAEDRYDIMFGIATILCWISPLSAIGIAIYGFAAGGKSLGIGALTSIVVVPGVFVIGCFAVLAM